MQEQLFYSDANEALRVVVASYPKGAKDLASRVWPAKKPDTAHQYLLAALSPDRAEKLDLDECIRLMQEAGGAQALYYACRELGHSHPYPVDPEDEAAQLVGALAGSVRDMNAITGRLERLGITAETFRKTE